MLDIRWNDGQDFSPLTGLNLTDFQHDEVFRGLIVHAQGQNWICEIQGASTAERVKNRTFPSIALSGSSLVNLKANPIRWLTPEDDPDIYYEEATKHDLRFYPLTFGLWWHLTPTQPHYGLSTRLVGDFIGVMNTYQEYAQRNPNMLFLPEIRLHNYIDFDALPPDSDFWLRDVDGQILKNDVPWVEWTIDILNPEVQQNLIERVVGIAECGLFDGVLFDAFAPYHVYFYKDHLKIATEEEVIQAYIAILKGIRARVRDDFLILVNRNENKSPRYAEWINGSFMEINSEYSGGYTYKKLREVEDALLWNEKHLREPRINVLQGEGAVDHLFGSPDHVRWMRAITTLSLTHSDGYCIFKGPAQVDGDIQRAHIWYDFWDADLGKPVGEKAQLYRNRDGVFIREFTNGWAVYNRSGQAQAITLPEQVHSVESGVASTQHTVPDLDGEIYLKQVANPADINNDGTVNVLDLVIAANAFGKSEPDLNGDGIVNVLDLVIVATSF